MDVAFLLDSSSSMLEAYPLQAQIALKMASHYRLSSNGTRASIIVYSNNAQIQLLLKDGISQQAFQQTLSNLPFLGLDTRIDRGLYIARLALFVKKYGARHNVPKILYVFTDGEQSTLEANNLLVQAEELRKLGVKLVVIGVGGAVRTKQLESLGNINGEVHYASSFRKLLSNNTVIQQIVNRTFHNLREYIVLNL